MLPQAKKVGTKVLDEEGLFNLIRERSKTHGKPEPVATTSDSGYGGSQDSLGSPLGPPLGSPEPPRPAGSSGMGSGKAAQEVTETKATMPPPEQKAGQSGSGSSSAAPAPAPAPAGPCETQMWVDKYKPKSSKNIIGQQGDKSAMNKLKQWLQRWHRFHSGANKVKVKACEYV